MILSLFNLRKIVSWIPVQCELANGDQREVGMGPDLPKTVLNFIQFHQKKLSDFQTGQEIQSISIYLRKRFQVSN